MSSRNTGSSQRTLMSWSRGVRITRWSSKWVGRHWRSPMRVEKACKPILSVPSRYIPSASQSRSNITQSARSWNDKTSTVTTIVGQIGMALIIGSIIYGTRNDTASFFQKGGVLFFAVLLNVLIAIGNQHSIQPKTYRREQASYAFTIPLLRHWLDLLPIYLSNLP